VFEKRWFAAVDVPGKVKDVVKSVSRYAPETFSAKFWTTTYLLTYLVGYINEERKQDTFNVQQSVTQTGSPKYCLFKNALILTNNK
jgi:hypothetical protein